MNNNTISKWFSMFVLMMVAGITGATAQSLTVADFSIEKGATKEIAISVAAAEGQTIYGIQTDITLSEGLTLTNAVAVDNNITLTKNVLTSGPTRVSLLSQTGGTITAGEAIKLTVTAASDFTGGTISLANSKLTTSTAGAEINVENATANVTIAEAVSEVTATYALQEGETHTSGEVVEVKDEKGTVLATLTFGESGEGFNPFKAAAANTAVEGFTAFTEGNGTNGEKAGGTFYTITPTVDATIKVAVVLNSGKAFYILEDGTALADYNGIKVDAKYYGTYEFKATANKAYKVYCAGSKLGFYGFEMVYEETTPAPEFVTTTFNFADPNFREKIGTAMADVDGFIYNETFTADGASLQITAGSAPSRVYVDNNRGQNLVTYSQYTTLTFRAPEDKAITKIEFTAAGNSNINKFTASSGAIEGMVWTGNAEGVRFAQGATSYLANAIVTLADKDAETAALPAIEYTECENIAAFNALEPGTYAKLTLTDAEVIGKSADGYSTVWVQDATGGAWIQYTSLNGQLNEKTKVNGTVFVVKRATAGNPQMKEAEATINSELNATDIDSYTAIEGTIDEVNIAANLNKVVKIAADSLEMTSATAGKLYVGDTSIDVNNGTATANQLLCKIADWEKDKKLENITIVAILSAKSATANQLLPISIEENAAKPKLILTLQGTVGTEVSLTFGAYNTEDTYGVDFGDGNVVEKKVGVNNAGPYNEEKQTTDAATVFTGTVAGDGTIKVYGINDIWYLVSSGAMPTTFDQAKLMNVVQMTITGANVESVDLPATLENLSSFSFNNSPVKSVDVSKVAQLKSLSVIYAPTYTGEMNLETIDLQNNTELTDLSIQTQATGVNAKLKEIDLSKNTKLTSIYLPNNSLEKATLPDDFTTKDANDANALAKVTIFLNNNKLTAINGDLDKLPAKSQINISGNKFTLATLPAKPANVSASEYTYAPQPAYEVAETLSELDLSSQLTATGVLTEPVTTTFSFVTAGGTALVEGIDYEVVEPGKFKFIKAQAEKVHGVMETTAFPKFANANAFVTTEFTVEGNEQEPIYIDTDLTAQFPTDYQGWTGATGLVGWAAPKVMTNDGREVAACERYESTCDNTGDVFTRTLTGLANGTYRIELYGAAAYTSGRGFESELVEGDETAVYLYAETAPAAGTRRAGGEVVKQYIPAHVATDFNGTGIASVVLDNVVVTDGTVKLGMYKEKPLTNWHVVQIKGVTAKVDAIELHTAVLEAAQTALASEDYLVVTGEERADLETAITNNTTVAEQTAEAYEAAVTALGEATTAFTAAKAAYEDYAAAQVYLVDLPYAKAEKKPVAEVATSAADATAKAEALIPALRAYYESNAALENVEGAVDMTSKIINPAAEDALDGEVWKTIKGEGSGGSIDIKNGEPWTDAAGVAEHRYFDGGDWGQTAWDVTLQQDVTLPAGKYLLTAKMRASADVEQTLFAGENTTIGLSVGAAGGVFNRGWNDASIEFELPQEATIAIGVRGKTEKQYNWMSFSDFRLVQFPAEVEVTHTWDFTKWSDETVANLKAEAAKVTVSPDPDKEGNTMCEDNGALWSDHEKKPGTTCDTYAASKDNCFWYIGGEAEPTANGIAIAEFAGLQFNTTYGASRALAIAVNYPSTSIGTYNGPSYLWFGGKGQTIMTIPAVKGGSTITIGVESHKSTEARGIQLFAGDTELKDANGDAVAAPKTYTEQSWVVPEGGEGAVFDITVKNTNGCHIYYIDAEIGEPVADAIKTLKVEMENGAVYNLNGQKVNKAQKGLYIINGKKVVIK